jgi:hypothetical protein
VDEVRKIADAAFSRAQGITRGPGGARIAAVCIDGSGRSTWADNRVTRVDLPHKKKPEATGCHAEIAALAYWFKNWTKGPTICVVVRAKKERRGGPFVAGMARPCKYCIDTLREFGVKEVVYTTGETNMFGHPQIKKEQL